MSRDRSGWIVTAGIVLAALALTITYAFAQPEGSQHRHPGKDAPIHEKFYNDWERPDFHGSNCCHDEDCYPTQMKRVGTTWYALKRRITKRDDNHKILEYDYADPARPSSWVQLPDVVVENNQVPGHEAISHVTNESYIQREPRESPDGRSHVCMMDMLAETGSTEESWYVICAVIGEQI